MLEFYVKQNVFLYAMIAAGIAGVWCLFWNNRFTPGPSAISEG